MPIAISYGSYTTKKDTIELYPEHGRSFFDQVFDTLFANGNGVQYTYRWLMKKGNLFAIRMKNIENPVIYIGDEILHKIDDNDIKIIGGP
ncbi:MAG: hypothetical protein H6550_14710 [Chitinophagales bacterium]|nr:hypothetical protein [Chitinophagales bacterium]